MVVVEAAVALVRPRLPRLSRWPAPAAMAAARLWRQMKKAPLGLLLLPLLQHRLPRVGGAGAVAAEAAAAGHVRLPLVQPRRPLLLTAMTQAATAAVTVVLPLVKSSQQLMQSGATTPQLLLRRVGVGVAAGVAAAAVQVVPPPWRGQQLLRAKAQALMLYNQRKVVLVMAVATVTLLPLLLAVAGCGPSKWA